MPSGKTTVYGQSAKADVTLSLAGISARHCEINESGAGFILIDLGSEHGTFVNGDLVSRQVLDTGDMVHLGPRAFRFSDGLLFRSPVDDKELSDTEQHEPLDTTFEKLKKPKIAVSPRALMAAVALAVVGVAATALFWSNDSDQKPQTAGGVISSDDSDQKPQTAGGVISSDDSDQKPETAGGVVSSDECGTGLPDGTRQVPNNLAMSERAFQIMEAKIRQAPPSAPSLSIAVSPNTPAQWQADLKPHLLNSNSFWACEVTPSEPMVVRILHPDDNDWLFGQMWEVWEPEGLTRDEVREMFAGEWWGLGAKYSIILRPPSGMSNMRDFGDTVAHEWVHHVQQVLEGYFQADLPCWWGEGHATYLGTAVEALGVLNIDSFGRFERAREMMVRGRSSSAAANRSTAGWYDWFKDQEPGGLTSTSCFDDIDIYGAGALASEYLIGQYGLGSVMRVHSGFKGSVDWESRVSTVYGKNSDALNHEMAEYLRSFAYMFR